MKVKLVISHASGDEGYEYEQRIKEYSSLMGVDTLFISDIIKPYRGRTEDGRKIYTPWDIYPHAPVVVNNYSIYAIDIKPKGFKVIELDDYVNSEAIELTRKVLTNPELAREMTEHNYELGRKYYSCSILRKKLNVLLSNCFGV